ncbi:MAG: SGNH/GDSL hydrolase family protein [Candidatus Krumholzibacteriota bacterium]|nr:SGNH/GDSL hydrolase family protein [Candidatus Krumholzibacteriota bacterium]
MNAASLIRCLGRWLVAAAVFGLVLELSARVDDRVRWNAPLLQANYTHAMLQVSDSLGRRNRPGARFEKWEIDRNGFRGPGAAVEKPAGVVRVVVAGASETFGLYESPGMEYAAQLDSVLERAEPGRFEVINAASAGMTPPRIRFLWGAHLRRFDPDVLVFYPSPAFYLDARVPRDTVRVRTGPVPAPPPRPRLLRKISIVAKRVVPGALQAWVNELLARREAGGEEAEPWEAPPPDRVAAFERQVTELVDAVRRDSVRVVLATHAVRFGGSMDAADRRHMAGWRKFYPLASADCLLEMDEAANEAIRRIGRERGIPVVDIARLVPAGDRYFADFAHFTDAGARLVAEALAPEVRAAATGDRPPPPGNASQ